MREDSPQQTHGSSIEELKKVKKQGVRRVYHSRRWYLLQIRLESQTRGPKVGLASKLALPCRTWETRGQKNSKQSLETHHLCGTDAVNVDPSMMVPSGFDAIVD